MLRITTHLETLLRIHDCVIIPQVGGFVLQSAPAAYIEDERLFIPMHKEAVFNAQLKHNDGLLCESYMQAYGLNYEQARRQVDEDVKELLAQLQKGLRITLGSVGTLQLDEEGKLLFAAGRNIQSSPESYGLAPFRLPLWRELAIEVSPANHNGLHRPALRRFLQGTTAVAAAMALFLLISTPVKNTDPSTYTASFLPTALDVPEPKAAQPAPVATQKKAENTYRYTAKSNSQKEKTRRTNIRKHDREPQKRYYIVIGSFANRTQARNFISYNVNFRKMGSANILEQGGKIRVYASVTVNKAQADAYLAQVRRSTQFYDAWLLAAK
ncbi:MAG: SPOR domain-containing protein [Tannerella sp.]|jgi:nucleoid DNA-binding protein|nr:SPOR domain-containing protein [Tannerella sp.]